MSKILTSLTNISLPSSFLIIGKQCSSRSDAAERGAWSGSTLFADRNFYQKYDKKEKMYTRHPLNEKQTCPIDMSGKVNKANVG